MSEVKIRAGDLHEAYESMEILKRISLTRASSYLIARLLKKLTAEFKTLEAQRLELVHSFLPEELHGIPGHNVPKEKLPDFNKQWEEVKDIEIIIDAPTIRLSDLKSQKGEAEIPPIVFLQLGEFFTE